MAESIGCFPGQCSAAGQSGDTRRPETLLTGDYERKRPWAAETRLEFETSAENVAEALAALNATMAAEADYAAQVEAEALALVEAEPDPPGDRYVNPNRWEPGVPE